MLLTRVAGRNFRLLEAFEVKPGPGINLIAGPNASGKTSLLEAIYLLGRAQSFRSAAPQLAGNAGAHWQIRGDFVSQAGVPPVATALDWTPAGLAVRVQDAPATVQDLVRRFAAQVLEPDSHRLLQEGPVYRRRYLDWGVFHVEHQFFPAWRRYQRALKQRNHALRTGAPDAALAAWTPELVAAGEAVHASRTTHLAALQEPLGIELQHLLPGLEWSLALSPGWAADQSLAAALSASQAQDRRQASTLSGPHRAELQLKLAGRSSKHQVSRGRQKVLIAALLLAQAELIRRHSGEAPALLIDDFPAELGAAFQEALLSRLSAYSGQVFLSAIELGGPLAGVAQAGAKTTVFHVEHGSVSTALRV